MWWHTRRNQISSFARNGRVHLNRRGRQFSRLLAAEVCASAVVMLDTPCFEVVWSVLATHSIRQFPLHFPSRESPCAITFQLDSTHLLPLRGMDLQLKECLPAESSVATSSKVAFLLNLNQITSNECLSRQEFCSTSMDSHKKIEIRAGLLPTNSKFID